MQNKKSVLTEGLMKIDFDPDTWGLVDKGILSKVKVSTLVKLNTGGEAKMNVFVEGGRLVESDEESVMADYFAKQVKGVNYFEQAFGRIMYQMLHFVTFGSNNWIVHGYVVAGGGSRRIPILLVYSETMKCAFYSMKRDTDTDGSSRNKDTGYKVTPWWLN